MIAITDREFEELKDYVLANYGIDLSKKRTLIQGRLTNTLVQKGMTTFSQYTESVKRDKSGIELQQMLNKLTTNLTYFMREKEHFDFLSQVVLPEFEQCFKGRQLRVWSAGCSSGEEPYTLAMTMLDFFAGKGGEKRFVILASDISQDVLGQAQRGVYSREGLKDVPPAWIPKYFDKLPGGEDYKVKDSVKSKISFRTFNLMDPFRFTKPFEIIFCRNVMIYFEKQKKEALVNKYYQWLAPGGYFFISHSENIGRTDTGFKTVRPSAFKKEG